MQEKETNKKNSKHPEVSRSCVVSRKSQISSPNICNNAIGSYSNWPFSVSVLRLKLVAMAIVDADDVQIHFGNLKLLLPRWSVHHENSKSLKFKTPPNLAHKPIWMQKENRYEMEH